MKRKMLIGIALICMGICISVVSCKKTDSGNVTEVASKEASLAAKFTSPIGADYTEVMKQYENLSETELKSFWLEIYKINSKTAPASFTPAEHEMLFDKFNNKSKSDFGVTMNKLNRKDLGAILGKRNNTKNEINSRPPIGGTTCEFLPYPELYTKNVTLPFCPPYNSYRDVDYYQGDCDGAELTYNGYYNRLRPITPLGDLAIAIFLQGDHIYSTITKTRVLHRKSSALGWFGSVSNININLRMANEFIVIGE